MTSPTVAIPVVAPKDLRSPRDGIRVSLFALLFVTMILTTLSVLVTGLGTPNYPAMLSLFMSLP